MRFLLAVLIVLSGALALPKMAIVIDDAGGSLAECREIATIPVSLNIAVMPSQAYSKACAKLVREQGQFLLIHFPWYPLGPHIRSYPVRVTEKMTTQNIAHMIDKAFQAVPGAQGINNHMGSKMSESQIKMHQFMYVLSQREEKTVFLDSHTSRKSLAHNVAALYKIPTTKNNVFLDGHQNGRYIEKQFRIAVRQAQADGSVVVICHANRATTRKVLKTLIDHYNKNVEYVFISDIIKERENAH